VHQDQQSLNCKKVSDTCSNFKRGLQNNLIIRQYDLTAVFIGQLQESQQPTLELTMNNEGKGHQFIARKILVTVLTK